MPNFSPIYGRSDRTPPTTYPADYPGPSAAAPTAMAPYGYGIGRAPRAPAPQTPSAPYEGYNTSNAFIGPGGTFNPNQGVGATIPDFYRQGAFDPSGGGAYLEAIKRMLGAREQSDIAHANLTSDIYGSEDPLARQYGRLLAQQSAESQYPALIAQYQAEAAARREQYIQQLLAQRLGSDTYQRQQRPDYGAIAGDIVGKLGSAAIGKIG